MLAMTNIGLGNPDEALAILERYPKAYPNERQQKLVRGIAYVKKGDLGRAREYLWDVRDPSISYEAFLRKIQSGIIFELGTR